MKFTMTENGFQTETSFGSLDISSNEEFGFRPYQLLVSSIAVCSGGVMRKVLERMRMPATDIRIEVKDVVRNPDEANKVEKIHLHFFIEGSKINEEKMPRVMDLTMKNCSMAQSVVESIEIHKTYEIK
ncbi:OsmC family protein [Sporosarcina sp. Marseille-Q4063]|uniref:OsmC family protein n=1 Tax=Sporosarcina sp. Marseille-Q4063 TaxID=2810514 RepID=UPI001BAED2B5|nr:OsmC family protein [Sporosarcina sp. Marseille-Q4063]QUW23497.1 OsmC family protein [Sporosarcina sp. Marseille-Q4063]